MELVGNVARRRHIQKRKQTLTPKPKKDRRAQLPDDWESCYNQRIELESSHHGSTVQETSLQTPLRRSGGSKQQWQADLAEMSRLKKVNDGTTLMLNVIDVSSKLAWCVPLNNKSAASLVSAFTPLPGNGAPNTLQTGKGTEFVHRPLQKLLKEHGVHHFATHNEETKASGSIGL